MHRVLRLASVLGASFSSCLVACSPATDVARGTESHDASSGGRGAGGVPGVAGSAGMAAASGLGGALNQAGAAQAGTSAFGGHAGTTLVQAGGNGATAGGGSGGGGGYAGIAGSVYGAGSGGFGGSGGSGGSGGNVGNAGNAGARSVGDGEYCAPCVTSSDCATGSYCVGGVNPRCGKACSADTDCTVGTATSTCEVLSVGGGFAASVGGGAGPVHDASASAAAGIGIYTCTPADSVCGTAPTSAVLTCNDTWVSYANNFFSTTCSTCHQHVQTFSTLAAVQSLADSIRLEVETGAMPAGTTLPAADRLRLLTWLACGAP